MARESEADYIHGVSQKVGANCNDFKIVSNYKMISTDHIMVTKNIRRNRLYTGTSLKNAVESSSNVHLRGYSADVQFGI